MKKIYWVFGLLMAALIGVLEFIEYKYFIRDMDTEWLIGILALIFVILGIWLGKNWKKPTVQAPDKVKLNYSEFQKKYNISAREMEVLLLMKEGLTNQEIGNKMFISLSTVKTHVSNLYGKLDVKRRTQALQKVQEVNFQ